MLVFSGKSTLEFRSMSNDAWKKEGVMVEVDDNITAITASREGTHLLVNISMAKPRIELITLDES
jgi:hypothetical protein